MTQHPPAQHCQLCGRSSGEVKLLPSALVRETLAAEIRREHPDWSRDGYICFDDLNRFRERYIESLLATEQGEVRQLESEVADSLKRHDVLSKNVHELFEQDLTFGQRLSDKIAEFGGSWGFIIAFGVVMAAWIAVNSVALLAQPFDPYPYILLNLVLSCLAALQAPVIMMSQNRQEAKDRRRSEHDYQINLKAELEIRHLHEKVDHLLIHQWERLVEIQRVQLELMNDLAEQSRRK